MNVSEFSGQWEEAKYAAQIDVDGPGVKLGKLAEWKHLAVNRDMRAARVYQIIAISADFI